VTLFWEKGLTRRVGWDFNDSVFVAGVREVCADVTSFFFESCCFSVSFVVSEFFNSLAGVSVVCDKSVVDGSVLFLALAGFFGDALSVGFEAPKILGCLRAIGWCSEQHRGQCWGERVVIQQKAQLEQAAPYFCASSHVRSHGALSLIFPFSLGRVRLSRGQADTFSMCHNEITEQRNLM